MNLSFGVYYALSGSRTSSISGAQGTLAKDTVQILGHIEVEIENSSL